MSKVRENMEHRVYSCGCANQHDEETGVLKCVIKCQLHQSCADRGALGPAYYKTCGSIGGELPMCGHYVREMIRGGLELPTCPRRNEAALEIGCGCSPYAPYLMQLGYYYMGLEPEPWAASWTREAYYCAVHCGLFENYEPGPGHKGYGLILAPHVFEHMRESPAQIRRATQMLRPGGHIAIIVPNDDDSTNPDHWWFYDINTLQYAMERAGLEQVRITQMKVVEHEHFLYAMGRRPE